MNLRIGSPEAMRALGAALARRASAGVVLALEGDLGAGKTCFAQGVGEGLGVQGPVTSPTFQIVAIYPGPGHALVHADLYRLGDPSELIELGLEEIFGREGVTVVEWADRFPEVLPADHLSVRIAIRGGDLRELALVAHGPKSQELLDSLGGEHGVL